MRTKGLLGLLALGGLLGASAPAAGVTLCFDHPATIEFFGTDGPDVFQGTEGDDVIIGLGGDDTLYGNGGVDRICGGEGDDRIFGGAGRDFLDGEGGKDKLYGQGGSDAFLLGGPGSDVLSPGGGSIMFTGTIEGGDGRDRVVIDREGHNEVFGGAGRDILDLRRAFMPMVVHLSAEFWNEDGGPVIGGTTDRVEDVYGSELDDYIWGNGRANRLYGFGGADHLMGRGGDDILYGGDGDDWLAGGDGWDACWQWEVVGVSCEN